MKNSLSPKPNGKARKDISRQIRQEAAEIEGDRFMSAVQQVNNGETVTLWPPVSTFTKCLEHDGHGFVNAAAFDKLIAQLNQSASSDKFALFPGVFTSKKPAPFDVPLFSGAYIGLEAGEEAKPRTLESPLAGHTYDLSGPDADAVEMPPAPALGSDELVAEMAELYAMALLRDVPFTEFEASATATVALKGLNVDDAIGALNALPWFNGNPKGSRPGGGLTAREQRRKKARNFSGGGVNRQTLFRGSTAGAQKGPYISQFLLIGNHTRSGSPHGHGDGQIQYGQQLISQKLIPHEEGRDFLQNWADWLDVQNGLKAHGRATFATAPGAAVPRFVHTPRDLATYVHFDALYQAYLNACLILMKQGCPFDAGLPEGAGHPSRDGFATFGGPHILSLLTEVATRALKAVRRQKFLIHLRARPEAVGGVLTLASSSDRPEEAADSSGTMKPVNCYVAADRMITELKKAAAIADALTQYNAGKLDKLLAGASTGGYDLAWQASAENWLLPMAFPEGSPAHGSYGAGHATVAGACTTVLKAFFEMFAIGAPNPNDVIGWNPGAIYRGGQLSIDALVDKGRSYLFSRELKMTEIGAPADRLDGTYRTNDVGDALIKGADEGLTVQGEIDKLAANISVGRDFAGVHYYTDYYESLRMGERIATAILQEQMLTYREPLSMRFTSFDGDSIMIVGSGGTYHGFQNTGYDTDDAQILVWPAGSNAPPWTKVPRSKPQARDTAIRDEAARWWNRALLETAS